MGIATFESELLLDVFYEDWLDELEEEPIENDEGYEAYCEEQIRLSKLTACEKLIEGYKDLTPRESAYIFDTMYESKKENFLD
jgi:hypothetical protein